MFFFTWQDDVSMSKLALRIMHCLLLHSVWGFDATQKKGFGVRGQSSLSFSLFYSIRSLIIKSSASPIVEQARSYLCQGRFCRGMTRQICSLASLQRCLSWRQCGIGFVYYLTERFSQKFKRPFLKSLTFKELLRICYMGEMGFLSPLNLLLFLIICQDLFFIATRR